MATLEQWVAGARPRTLPAAFAPVIAGTAAAGLGARPVYGYALLADEWRERRRPNAV